MALVPERFIWATDLLALEPDFNILEIGCGAGIFADCIADKLTSGNVLAIDRSAPMIAKAIKRNQHHIVAGKATLRTTDFKSLTPSNHFDRVVAFNVNFFWSESAREINLIRNLLKKKGKLFVFQQAPYEISISSATPVKKLLTANGFNIVDVKLKKLKPTSAICVVAAV